ncbi:MAG: hypothetical protein ACPL5I_15495 [Thermodesulfobacteriota bacterium]
MTHTLHRSGIDKNEVNDYVILAMVEGEDQQKINNLAELFRIVLKHKPINYTGKALFPNPADEQLLSLYRRIKIGMAVFNNRETLLQLLQEIKDKEFGVSVVVSGLFSHIAEDCQKIGLRRHTINFSIGIWGKRELLPSSKILAITTMCGHGLVSFNLVQFLIDEIKKGKKTEEEAAEILSKPCVCGVFNPMRAARLLREISRDI